MARQTMKIREAAEMAGLSLAATYRAASRGEIPVIRIGRRLLVKRSEFEAMLGIANAPHGMDQGGTVDARTA